ncbi:NUDIX domain-containing protein [soil metagenome]
MPKAKSAGLLMYRWRGGVLEYFLAHPGGPLFTKKDEGWWGIPKGLLEGDEDELVAAQREFQEETGIAPAGEFIALGEVVTKSGKRIAAWAFEWTGGELPPIVSNLFSMEWPPKSGRTQEFPEVDRAQFFGEADALRMIGPAQAPLIERLKNALSTKQP